MRKKSYFYQIENRGGVGSLILLGWWGWGENNEEIVDGLDINWAIWRLCSAKDLWFLLKIDVFCLKSQDESNFDQF